VVSAAPELTKLLNDWQTGDQAAFDKLITLVYDELHQLAHRYMRRERPGHTLQTTALVDELFLRLVEQKKIEWKNRTHFFAVAARVMRHVLIDYARCRVSPKHGGDAVHVPLDEGAIVSPARSEDLIEVDDALVRLAEIDPRKAQIVELRFFGGMSVEEIAEVLEIAAITVKREWQRAKAWLYRELCEENKTDL